MSPTGGSLGVFGMTTSYATCSVSNPSPGTQVTATDPTGKVIGTGTLGAWNHDTVTAGGITGYRCDMPFTVAGVPQEPRYGYQINGVTGTLWETGTTVTLSVGSSSG